MERTRLVLIFILFTFVSCAQKPKVGIVCEGVEIPAPIEGEIVLERMAYITSYNKETLCPNWVAWKLTAEHTDGEVKRIGAYFEDEDGITINIVC